MLARQGFIEQCIAPGWLAEHHLCTEPLESKRKKALRFVIVTEFDVGEGRG